MGKLIFGPTIDQFATNSFLPCSVDELISTGNQIPIIVGYNSNIHFGIPKGTKTHCKLMNLYALSTLLHPVRNLQHSFEFFKYRSSN